MNNIPISTQIENLIVAHKSKHETHLMLKDVLIEQVAKVDADILKERIALKENTEPARLEFLDKKCAV